MYNFVFELNYDVLKIHEKLENERKPDNIFYQVLLDKISYLDKKSTSDVI